jgi:O-acetyl-ADP-ribose deacetylase
MDVTFKTGDIVDEEVEGLVCSGNVQLNMTGGVNGELLRRGGQKMQLDLHGFLKKQDKRYVEPGFVMAIGPAPSRFKCVVYTVAVDAFYESSVDLVAKALTSSLSIIEKAGCTTAAVPALATGYGNLSKEDFGKALRQCLDARAWTFSEVRVVMRQEDDVVAVRKGYGA